MTSTAAEAEAAEAEAAAEAAEAADTSDDVDMVSAISRFKQMHHDFEHYKSVSFSDGDEGKPVIKDQYLGRSLAVFTSGGDSQGMNAAVRAVVRMGIYLGCKVYFIHEGYQGMVFGGKYIEQATWASVSGIVGTGGTIIGTARCMEFKERSGRLRAACNLVKYGINNLVCIGGDGTLTGANLFKKEWPSILDELLATNEITHDERIACDFLNIVGLVGSIDNDFCGTDMTIGADTALHRIMEAVDAIVTTALSHQRCFVLEVMGRHCGYLALVAGLACDADWIVIPEHPPEPGWEDKLCERLQYQREAGHRLNIIVVSEGAIDSQGNRITSDYVQKVVIDKLHFDTRVTVLGHVQRGGYASAFDRCLGTRMGSEAVLALLSARPESHPVVIAIKGYSICHIPLVESVERTQAVAKAMAEKDFQRACELRGPVFQRNLESYLKLNKIRPKLKKDEVLQPFNLAIVHVGSPTSGVNSAVRSFVRHGLSKGCKIFSVRDGLSGLIEGNIEKIEWKTVYGWTNVGGSMLGSQRVEAEEAGLGLIAEQLEKFNIHGLLIIGGFEAYKSVLQLKNARSQYKQFQMPIVCIPATISNNVPGTDFSIGCDTSLNEIVTICDKIKQSAIGYKRRVFVVETMGAYCGYLATMSGLASGADQAYIFEEPFTIDDLIDDANYLIKKMKTHQKTGILIRNENANVHYTTDFITSLLTEEGKNAFNTRSNILGHMQQGGTPSPFDRTLGIKLAEKSLNFMLNILNVSKKDDSKHILNDDSSAVVIGVRNKQISFTSVESLRIETDFVHRIPRSQWWLSLRPLLRILAHHDAMHMSEIKERGEDDLDDEDDGMLKMWN